ncbi:deleted in malignant brain tumors 1 protein-like [Pomacea canaliculata]|uniref:deleted in malignant brain tumors 1 protein-like n=1 Tax=Pomacea canaliculata TaxID=400727 RepID=UPI000D73D726|nr:deleted in malignant brain tumors 1 protein-like [Pomacea canaliculata]
MDLTLLATCFLLALCLKDVDGLKARLVQGTNNSETSKGRLEILHNGAWSTVCDDRFGKTEAEVACRMLGFNTARSLAVRSSMYGQGSDSILLDDVRCQGSETDLLQCQHRGLYTHNCKHDEDVGIICTDQREQVRLTGSQLTDRGRVELQLGSEWFTVCVPDDNFPKVVCRQLGLPIEEASIMPGSLFGQSQSQQLMVQFACKGEETSILDCDQLTDSESCRKLDIGVICFQSVQSIARLVQGTSPCNGLLEVLYNGSYAPVFTDQLRIYVATVACRTLGFNSSRALAVDSSMFKSIPRNQYIQINCGGTESSLTQCRHTLWDNDLKRPYGFGLICSNHHERLRLKGTSRTRQDMGRVEIQLAYEWYSLLVYNYDLAKRVCRLLNLPWKEAVQLWDSPGQMEKPELRNILVCFGEEVSLLDCLHVPVGNSEYSDSDFFGVFCSNSPSLLIHPGEIMYPFDEGTNVTLKCGYRKWTLYNVTWPENAGGVSNGNELRIDKVTRAHNGSHVKCEAMYNAGNLQSTSLTSDTLELQVYYKPSILITSNLTTCRPQPPQNVCVVTHNTSVTIVCEADSNPPPANITWSGPVSSGTQELHLTPANSSTHQGLYTCSVFTQELDGDKRLPLSSNYTFSVIIQDRPAVLSFQLNNVDNKSVTVSENFKVKMSCLASGRPNMVIMKELNKEKLQIQSQEDIMSIKGEKNYLNHSISNVACQQSGDYRCEVNNDLGNDSQTVRLLVQCAPKTETQVVVPSVDISSNERHFSINLTSYPAPQLTNVTHQSVDGKVRPRNSFLNKLQVTWRSMPATPASVTCDLSVANVTQADTGLYTIVFSNSLGNTSFNFLLTSKGVWKWQLNYVMMSH